MIKESTLSSLSESCDLGKYIRLGKGEEKNNGSKKKSILSDVFESFVASLYLEKGGKKVWEFLNLTIFSWVKGKENLIWDHKSQLQEYCQSKKFSLNYETDLKSIINNQQFFLSNVIIKDQEKEIIRQKGVGKNKKDAEQEADKKAIEILKIN